MALGKIADVNLAEEAVLSGGNWVLPLSNMLSTLMLAEPARCAAPNVLADSQFTLTLSRTRAVNLVALLFHNMSAQALYRLSFRDDQGGLIFQTSWRDVAPRLFPSLSLDWEQSNYWTGQPSEDDLALYPQNLWHSLSDPILCRSIDVEIDDRDTPKGFFDIGYLYIANAWSPKFNFAYGREITLLPRDRTDEALSGHQLGEYRRPRRQARFEYQDLAKNELMRFMDLGMRAGTVHPVVLIPDIDNQTHINREAFLATLESLPGAAFEFEGRHRSQITLKEIIR